MPIYSILKKILGGYVDIFVFIIILIMVYFKAIELRILYSCLETLIMFYVYKIYHWIFARQFKYWKGEKVGFTWDFFRIFSEKFIEKHCKKMYIILCIMVMPFNMVWFLLVNFAVFKKLAKVWFNGNKDIFFKKHFDYDVRKVFDRYIVFYYDYMDKYVRILIHEPLLRIVIIPTLIRNSLIHSSYFSILKGRMFMFLFVSFLVFSGLIEYLRQPVYIWIIIIYFYFLIVWPRLIKFFKIEYNYSFFNDGTKVAYTTPKNIISAYLLVEENSISLNYINLFINYINNINKVFFYFYRSMFPRWYILFLRTDNYNNKGFLNYFDIDRKFAGLMFWRYEKTYSSLICLNLFWEGKIDKIMLTYHLANKFYPFYFTKEEMEEVKEKYLILLKMYIYAICDSDIFLDILSEGILYPMFFNDRKENITKGEYNLYLCYYVYNWNEFKHNDELNLCKYKLINDYIDRIKVASFFFNFYNLKEIIKLLDKWISIFFFEVKNEYGNNKKEEERRIKFDKLSLEEYNKAGKIFENRELNEEFKVLVEGFGKEFEKEFNKNPRRFIDYEKVEEIIKILKK